MTTLYITEGRLAGAGGLQGTPMMGMPKVAGQTVAIGATTVQSAAFNANTQIIRLESDVVCSVEIGGANPVATAASQRMAAGVPEYFAVTPGDKLAVITNT
jgi:DUF917 family protein